MTAPRHDLYAFIHKALRAHMSHTLLRVGRLDATDEQEVAEVLTEVRQLLELCDAHVHHENEVVHAAMEARAPGSTRAIADDHEQHLRDLAALHTLADRATDGPAAVHALYHALAAFVAHNFEHMAHEETHHNEVLWAAYSDEELRAIEHRIHQIVKPTHMTLVMRWMLPHLAPAERAAVLGGVRLGAPKEAFAGLLEMVRPLLPQRDWRKLSVALGL